MTRCFLLSRWGVVCRGVVNGVMYIVRYTGRAEAASTKNVARAFHGTKGGPEKPYHNQLLYAYTRIVSEECQSRDSDKKKNFTHADHMHLTSRALITVANPKKKFMSR